MTALSYRSWVWSGPGRLLLAYSHSPLNLELESVEDPLPDNDL